MPTLGECPQTQHEYHLATHEHACSVHAVVASAYRSYVSPVHLQRAPGRRTKAGINFDREKAPLVCW